MLSSPTRRPILVRTCRACLVFGSFLVLNLSVLGAGQTPETTQPPDSEFDLDAMRVRNVTRTREMRIGRQASRRFERRIRLLQNGTIQEYADRIAQSLATSSGASVPITIKVVDSSSEVNAVSFPGGYVYISSGLLLAMDDEAEIASVVAHEIAHIVARDGLKNNPYLGTGSGRNSMIIVSPDESGTTDFGGLLAPLVSLGSPLEVKADALAVDYMEGAGYDPEALIGFLEKLHAKEVTEQNSVLPMFQTHPATAQRIQLAKERIGATHRGEGAYADTSGELQTIKELLIRIASSRPYE